MGTAAELIPGFGPETELEGALAVDPALLAGLAWGAPRPGHPEGAVGTHVADLLRLIDESGVAGPRRSELRFLAVVHDAFKNRVNERLPRMGENHHAMRARRFAEGLTDDERLLSAIELHDRPYGLWRRSRRKGHTDVGAFAVMMAAVRDPELFVAFVELDASTEGKRPEPVKWFRAELEQRGYVAG